jgi:ABC-type nickel/cobalt efflux system permease component RcnA
MVNRETVQTESIGDLMRGILADLRTLIREEIALARVELKEQALHARGAAISFGVMAVALLLGIIFLLAAIGIAVADLMNWPAWAVFLGMAVLLSGIGVLMLSSGRKQIHEMTSARVETVAAMKENATWIAKRLSFDRK